MAAVTQSRRITELKAAADEASVVNQNWKLLRQFNLYRLILALALVAAAVTSGRIILGVRFNLLFVTAGAVYSGLALVAMVAIHRRWLGFSVLTALLTFADILAISLLMFSSAGLGSGLSLLLLVSVAECSVLLGRRLTIFYASLATLAALGEHSMGLLFRNASEIADVVHGFPKIGMLGIGLFITATLGNSLAARLRSTAALAERQGRDLASLANINDLIIERMQSGVLGCDPAGLNECGRELPVNPVATPPLPAKTPALARAHQMACLRIAPGCRPTCSLPSRGFNWE